ncbi:hypothetical protein [Luteolibacter yonseiensis]|nr:hypothetical protein [Luteolibacter yonseiensis]
MYWTDLIHVMRWNAGPVVENRLKGGLSWWGVWALLQLFSSRDLSPAPDGEGKKSRSPVDGYRLLPTPAHRDSLIPLIEASDPESVRIYGEDAGLPNLPAVPFDFSNNLRKLGFRQRSRSLLTAFKTHRRLARILAKCVPREENLPPAFHPRLIEQIFTMELGLARLRGEEPRLRSLYVTYELAPDSKALVRWARETGADVIHVMHGQRLPTYQLTQATDLILLSKIDEAWFRPRVDPAVRIHCHGHPRLEKIHQTISPPSRDGRTRPRIAFFSQPAEGDYTRERRDEDYRILAGLIGKADVRIRLHPREPVEEALLAMERAGATAFGISGAGLEDDLRWCDAIASSWSTVALEAAACGRGIFWTCAAPERYEASQELREHGIGVLIDSPGKWQPHLDQWTSGPWNAPVVVPDDRLAELGLIGMTGGNMLV